MARRWTRASLGRASAFVAIATAGVLACSSFAPNDDTDEPPLEAGDSSPTVEASTEASPDVLSADAGADAADPVINLVSAGDTGCALRGSGRVWCWGSNNTLATGQPAIGDLACEENARCRGAAEVPGLQDVVQLAGGSGFFCARRKDGAVLCWGGNSKATLGTGTATPAARAAPEVVAGLSTALDIVAGSETACARVMEDGGVRVYCWGSNEHVLLATIGNTVFAPRPLPQLDGAKSVRLGLNAQTACAITADNHVVCWGRNFGGVLGHPFMNDITCVGSPCNPTPMLVGDAAFTVSDLEVGYFAACARPIAGGVHCWGANEFGLLGRGAPTDSAERPTPAPIPELANATSISLRSTHACALLAGVPYCWGANEWGQLGDGLGGVTCTGRLCQAKPVMVALGSIAEIAAGNAMTLTRAADGSLASWGANYDARLGHLPGTSSDLVTCGGTSKRCNPKPTPLLLP